MESEDIYVTFQFEGNKDEIALLYGDIVNCVVGATKEKYGYYPWLGELLIDAGMEEKTNIKKDDYISCHGQIDNYIYNKDNTLTVEVTSRVPMAKMWQAILDKKGYKSIKFAYQAINFAENVFEIYNPYNIKNDFCYYSVDICVPHDCAVYDFETKEEVCDFINNRFECCCKSYEEAVEFIARYDFNDLEHCWIDEVTIVDKLIS